MKRPAAPAARSTPHAAHAVATLALTAALVVGAACSKKDETPEADAPAAQADANDAAKAAQKSDAQPKEAKSAKTDKNVKAAKADPKAKPNARDDQDPKAKRLAAKDAPAPDAAADDAEPDDDAEAQGSKGFKLGSRRGGLKDAAKGGLNTLKPKDTALAQKGRLGKTMSPEESMKVRERLMNRRAPSERPTDVREDEDGALTPVAKAPTAPPTLPPPSEPSDGPSEAAASPSDAAAPSDAPSLSGVFNREAVRIATGYRGLLRPSPLPGQPLDAYHTALRLRPASATQYGIGLEVWMISNPASLNRKFDAFKRQYPGAEISKEFGDSAFRAEFGELSYYVWVDRSSKTLSVLSCDNVVCDQAKDLVVMARRVTARLKDIF